MVAAGRGERLGSTQPKALVPVAGRPMLQWSVDALRAANGVGEIVVALPADRLDAAPSGTRAVAGEAVRSASVRAALEVAAPEGDPVVVQDAARPLLTAALVDRLLVELAAAPEDDAVIAAAPVPDTIKEADAAGKVVRTLERARLWAVQTPQVFRRRALEAALDADDAILAAATDDAALVERAGGRVRVVAVLEENLKITTRRDLHRAEELLRAC